MAAEDRKGLRVKNLLWVGETEQEAENVLVYFINSSSSSLLLLLSLL